MNHSFLIIVVALLHNIESVGSDTVGNIRSEVGYFRVGSFSVRLKRTVAHTALPEQTEVAYYSKGHAEFIESHLQRTPELVLLLGRLMIQSTRNVEVKMSEPLGGWKFVKYPEKFQATLTQVTQEALSAVINSTNRMHTIQGDMEKLPAAIFATLQLLSHGDERIQVKHLPNFISKINKIKDVTLEEARMAEAVVQHVGLLMDEVYTSTTAVNVHRTMDSIDQTKEKEVKHNVEPQERIKRIEQNLKRVKQLLEILSQEFEAAVKIMPSKNDFLRNRVLSIGITINSYALATSELDHQEALDREILSHLYAIMHHSLQDAMNLINHTSNAYSVAQELTILPNVAIKLLDALTVSWSDREKAVAHFNQDKLSIEMAIGLANKQYRIDSDDYLHVLQVLSTRADLTEKYAKSDEAWNIIQQNDAVDNSSRELKAKTNYVKIQFEADNLEVVKQRLLQEQSSAQTIMDRLSNLETIATDEAKIYALLNEALNILHQTQDRWTALRQYIGGITSIAKNLKTSAESFVDAAEQPTILLNISRNLLRSCLTTLNSEWLFITKMASTYVAVSQRFILPRLSAMNQYAILETEEQRDNALKQLKEEANEIKQEIDATMIKRLQELEQKLEHELDLAKQAVEEIGNISDIERKDIEDSVKLELAMVK